MNFFYKLFNIPKHTLKPITPPEAVSRTDEVNPLYLLAVALYSIEVINISFDFIVQ
ncbi:hypothetical protein CLU83_0511 [Flavobacterium sp. 1]|nr:hypothetical protein CLU83_0511 [Flavobacterium sp. 1]